MAYLLKGNQVFYFFDFRNCACETILLFLIFAIISFSIIAKVVLQLKNPQTTI